MMRILKSTATVTAYGTFAFACGYGGFKFGALILPSLVDVDADAEFEKMMKANMEQTKLNIKKQEENHKKLMNYKKQRYLKEGVDGDKTQFTVLSSIE